MYRIFNLFLNYEFRGIYFIIEYYLSINNIYIYNLYMQF